MASFHAIAVTANTIRSLLAEACPRDVFGGVEFRLCLAASLASVPFTDLGVSIYLYHVGFNASRRSLSPRVTPRGLRFKPPVPLDLHFLITAWARTPEQQWALLAWTIRAVEDSPMLPAGLLNQNAGSDASGRPLTVFRDDEAVELVGETLSLKDLVDIWEVAKANQQPSTSVVARSILIDSGIEVTDGRPVQTRAFDFAAYAQ